MSARPQLAVDAPDWVIAEMPPGYQNRVAEIRRLTEELKDMDRFSRLLWTIGPELRASVREVFASLKFDVKMMEAPNDTVVAVSLDANRRLLLHVSGTEGTIDKRSAEVAQVFRLLHEVAGEDDRVVLVSNGDRVNQPPDRAEEVSAEALKLVERMGVNCVTAPTLFKLWALFGQEPERARKYVSQLQEQDGGTFVLPSSGF